MVIDSDSLILPKKRSQPDLNPACWLAGAVKNDAVTWAGSTARSWPERHKLELILGPILPATYGPEPAGVVSSGGRKQLYMRHVVRLLYFQAAAGFMS